MTDTQYLTSSPETGDVSEKLEHVRPFWALKNTEKARQEWNAERLEANKDATASRASIMFKNNLLYRGSQWESQDSFGDFRTQDGRHVSLQTSKVVIPELFDFLENTSNRIARFSTNITVVPHTGEHSDKKAAKAVKKMLETIAYENRLRSRWREAVKNSIINSYYPFLILWDQFKSDISPKWIKAEAQLKKKYKGKSIPTQMVEVDGEKFLFDENSPLRQGDVCFISPSPWEITLEPKTCPEDVGWMSWDRWVHIDIVDWELKHNPIFAGVNIKREQLEKLIGFGPSGERAPQYVFDPDSCQIKSLKDHIFVSDVYGRADRYSRNGMLARFVGGQEIYHGENPYPRLDSSRWGNLPFEWLTDIDLPNQLYPFSTFQILAPLQHTMNQFYSMMKRNVLVAGHPKILAPHQAKIKTESLNNDISIVRYRHPYKPETITPATLPQELFVFVDNIAKKMTQIEGRQSTSKGELPSNIRSGKQIQMLEELESLRSGERNQKKDEFIVAVNNKIKALIGDKYKEDDKRMLKYLGRDKMPLIEAFNISDLNKPSDVRVIPASGLPDIPSARISAVKELYDTDLRRLYPDEQWAGWLDLGEPGKFFDAVTAAADKANWENESFTDGDIPPDPEEGDDHVVHWRTHMTLIRSQAFLNFSDEVKEEIITHTMIHEMFLTDHVRANPSMGQVLLSLPSFPAYYSTQPQAPVDPSQLPRDAEGSAGQPQNDQAGGQAQAPEVLTNIAAREA